MHNKKSFLLFNIAMLFMLIMTSKVSYAYQHATLVNVNPATHTINTISGDDPFESFNRTMFAFNDNLDIYVLKPVATLYTKIVPKPLNQGIHNFFNNIGNLPTIANDLLQLNGYQAINDSWRLVINTTVGIGGLFDVASRMGLKPYTNDFGLTLAKWGYKQSYYLVLPFFGPTTVRDGIGLPVDYFGFSIYPYIYPISTRYEIYALGVVDRRAQLLDFQPVFEEAALDKYVFIRNAFMQRRAYQIEQNQHLSYGARDLFNPADPSAKATTESGVVVATGTPTDPPPLDLEGEEAKNP